MSLTKIDIAFCSSNYSKEMRKKNVIEKRYTQYIINIILMVPAIKLIIHISSINNF